VGFSVPATQVAIMFGLIALGWIAFRVRWIGTDALKGMTNLLLYLVSPAVIVMAFQRDFDPARLRLIGLVFALDVVSFVIVIGLARALFLRRFVPDDAQRIALRFGTVYSNAGFIGIPLAQALLGDDGVFYAVAYIAVFNAFVWTHGTSLFGHGDLPRAERIKKVLLNPNIVAIVVALLLFVASIHIPSPVSNVVVYVASMNTPLSMIVIGVTLADFSLRTVFKGRLVWLGVLARNVVVPLLFVLLLWPLPLDHVARLAILISISTPVGATVVIFSVQHGRDAQFATRLLTLSTLLSLLTVPSVLVLAGLLW
jgi:malate permease and related proteins